ncbi:regulator of G-protein signaling 3-like [Salvelinus namaycush]|uniref:Regulator of G-protein signaling 3-like n=1 Tax=Salvelinus namaycush TaxID=8040 RepID=A0A8U0PQB7_SALNM|nr:regulator of G-protein signaling 3-like [Salvelinus namaycush]
MRRFSSEGSLLNMDFLPWKKVELKNQNYHSRDGESGTYTPHLGEDELDGRTTSLPPTPLILEPEASPGRTPGRGELGKEHSVSVENVTDLGKPEGKGHLRVVNLSEGCRAYSDGQLAPATLGSSTESVGRHGRPPPSPSYSTSGSSPFSFKSQQRSHARAKLSAAKLHLKSLFGQSPHSSHSNLFNPEQKEQKDRAKEQRSRLPFLRQWSQVGHSKAKFSREELDKWAESLDALLASRTGVSVFGAFLRSEFSEENLQFYLACEQYRNSSNNFSLHRRAKEITVTYIEAGAPREVNLDSKTRDLTTQLLRAPSHTSLSHAQKRIYSLLDTDCYPRFLQSTIYLTLLGQAD